MYKYAILALTLSTSQAMAEVSNTGKVYAELDALYFSSPGDFDGEQTMGLTLGYSLSERHSLEAELQVNGLDSQKYGFEADADLITYLLGYRYNFKSDGKLTYFAGFGVGYSQAEYFIDSENTVEQNVTIGFARVGLDYDFSANAYLSAELRYQHIPDLDKNQLNYDIGGVPVVGISFGYRF
ncbi:outer membrane beta-barrel protein [Thalassotalea ponticola]|uniref:outer membrane beta-barrel protein n=1 Tax=Thalassotalea ponticola TaxID=1523392 RepID=UPI0025B3BBFD|nr:outer membrane beta-barrel protein [Thalassotalea ponticola]MDN3653329.1 outer membrane beta-barrel protein [Thalassotalea ponticola]